MTFTTFPLWPIVGGKCSCGDENCENVGKHPKVAWAHVKAGSHAVIGEGGIGVATGTRSGVFVIDLDGEEAIRHFFSLGDLPKTYTVKTGRAGGVHLYFQYPDFLVRNDVGRRFGHPKIDVRAEGGYVVAEGSPHASGKKYTRIDATPPAQAPAWILDRLKADAPERREAAAWAPTEIDVASVEGIRRVRLAKSFLAEEAVPSVQGENGSRALWIVANKMIRSYELPLDTALSMILEHYNPRCSPEWSEREILHKLEDARDRGTWLCGIAPEDFPQSLINAAKPAATKNLVRTNAPVRRQPNPSHAYSHVPGFVQPQSDRRKIPLSEAVATLTSHPDWMGVWQFDVFKKRTKAVDPPVKLDAEGGEVSEGDIAAIRTWFEANGVNIGKNDIIDAVNLAAAQCSYHPVREYLAQLPQPAGKGTPLLDVMCDKALGNDGPEEAKYLKMFMVAAVRRILHPGTKMDTILVLFSMRQGRGKSRFVEALFGKQWYREQMPALDGRDASHALEGYWGVEVAEMSSIVKADPKITRDFLSRSTDQYRQYGTKEKLEVPRQCVFIGTTNQTDFLIDETGNRRFWVIKTGIQGIKIDIGWVTKNRDRLWAEAVMLAQDASFLHYLDDAGEDAADVIRDQFSAEDPWSSMVQDYCAGQEWVRGTEEIFLNKISAGDLGAVAKMGKNVAQRIGAILRKSGCERTVRVIDGKSIRYWRISDALKSTTPSSEEIRRRTAYGVSLKLASS